jgi:Dolichyl-phosphate-mannose-protein mannosyltransferase
MATEAPFVVQPGGSAARLGRGADATPLLVLLAVATVAAHLLTGNRYGFHRDELATLDDARQLAWGYIAYPPITPFFGRLSLALFETSLTGFRFFAAVAEAMAVVLTGWMARELGGGRAAQLVAAAAALPFCLAAGALMQYVSFDYFFWVLTAYFVLRLLKSGDERWWIPIGAGIGLGLMAKYAMLFFMVALVAGMLLSNLRRQLLRRWFWCGAAIAIAIWLPNLVWEAQHHFISLDFLKHIHARDVRLGRTRGFLPDQFRVTFLAFPLWIAGLGFYLFIKEGKRYRVLGWIYVITLALFLAGKGRGYYMAATYPMLYAGGSVWGERWLKKLPRKKANAVRWFACLLLAVDIVFAAVLFLRLFPIESRPGRAVLKANSDLREEIGWPELVATVAHIRDGLPAQDRSRLGILVANYGEAGAVDLYGPKYGLPHAISGVNSFWLRGYGDPPPQTLIMLGFTREQADSMFSQCVFAGHASNPYGVENEETTKRQDILLCRNLRSTWANFWSGFQYFG